MSEPVLPPPATAAPPPSQEAGPGVRRGTVTPPPRLREARFFAPLARDLRRLQQVKGRGFMLALLDGLVFDSGFQALLAYRMAHALLRWRVPVLPAACRRWAIGACGVDILPRAEIGGGCIIAHGVGLVIGGYTVIGEDCTLLHGVTLGEARFDELDYPRVGDRVTIGAGALVLGGVHVGDDATIAAGAVVVDDVAAGTTVAGVPARPVRPPAATATIAPLAPATPAPIATIVTPATPAGPESAGTGSLDPASARHDMNLEAHDGLDHERDAP